MLPKTVWTWNVQARGTELRVFVSWFNFKCGLWRECVLLFEANKKRDISFTNSLIRTMDRITLWIHVVLAASWVLARGTKRIVKNTQHPQHFHLADWKEAQQLSLTIKYRITFDKSLYKLLSKKYESFLQEMEGIRSKKCKKICVVIATGARKSQRGRRRSLQGET